MEHSAGIIVYRKRNNNTEFFLCSPGGPAFKNRQYWGFPKGHLEENENSFEAAVREFAEETGVEPPSKNRMDYTFHGDIKQRNNKIVSVYSIEWDTDLLSNENCYSNMFTWKDGKEYPEIGKYQWMTFDELTSVVTNSVYNNIYQSL